MDLMTPIEKAAMHLLLAGELPALDALREQALQIIGVKRTRTVVGFYSQFELAKSLPPLSGKPKFVIADVGGAVSGTIHGACFTLFIKDGRLAFLEGATFGGEKWPENIIKFKLTYDTPNRDLQ